jgi:hypothetical protein
LFGEIVVCPLFFEIARVAHHLLKQLRLLRRERRRVGFVRYRSTGCSRQPNHHSDGTDAGRHSTTLSDR